MSHSNDRGAGFASCTRLCVLYIRPRAKFLPHSLHLKQGDRKNKSKIYLNLAGIQKSSLTGICLDTNDKECDRECLLRILALDNI